MPKESELCPADSPTALFGFELRRYRKARSWSQIRLSKAVSYSIGTISMIETARRSPTEDFARRCDEALEAEGALMRLWPMVSHASAPPWFRPWLDVEATAEAIRTWEPLVVPGLLQTEDYARAVLSGDAGVAPEQIEEQVIARMERQSILRRPKPPLLWVVIDEAVLHRPIGSPAVMSAQLTHLLEARPSPPDHHPDSPAQRLLHDRACRRVRHRANTRSLRHGLRRIRWGHESSDRETRETSAF